MATDPLAAELAAIREMADQITGDGHIEEECGGDLGRTCTGHDAERLARAVEAVLAPHQAGRFVVLGRLCKAHSSHGHFSITATEAAQIPACPDCSASVYVSCAGCGPQMALDQCPTRLAITTELLRGNSGDRS